MASSANFKSLRVVPHYGTNEIGGFDVFWTVECQGFSAPSFVVEQADIEQGPWTAINEPIEDTFLLNASSKVLVFGSVVWFRVKVFNGDTLVATSVPMDNRNSLNPRDYRYYRELLRRWRLQLEKYTGIYSMLLRRKIYGATCRVCCDEILQQSARANCPQCFGTGIVGGYFPSIKMFAQEADGPMRSVNTLVKTEPGPSQIERRNILVFPFPEARTDDIWVDMTTGMRFLVEKSEVAPNDDYRGLTVRQTLEISLQPPKNPVYDVPLYFNKKGT